MKFVFYTVDPVRDQADLLLQYLSYFDSDFIGLRAKDDKNKVLFEKKLAIKVNISEHQDNALNYSVSHDVALFLINPEGKLQAVLKPESSATPEKPFSSDIIYQDLLKVVAFYRASL